MSAEMMTTLFCDTELCLSVESSRDLGEALFQAVSDSKFPLALPPAFILRKLTNTKQLLFVPARLIVIS